MHFLAPHLLHLAWLALIPLALYLFRRRAKKVPVSTLLFFRALSREHQESAWLRRLKRLLSLLLTLLVLLLGVFALARPVTNAGVDSEDAIVLVVDCSASMAAQDAKGQNRLQIAQRQLSDKVRGLPSQTILSLIAVESRPRVLLSRSRNQRDCLRAIEALKVSPVQADDDGAKTAARRLADLETRSLIWHASDTAWAPTPEELGSRPYEFIDCAMDAPVNVGITAFQIRPAPLSRDRFEGFLKISAAAANPQKVTSSLEVHLGGRLAQLREIELAPGQSASLLLPLEGVHGQQVEFRLSTPSDCLAIDNGVVAPLPESSPLIVAWFAEKPDPFTELALKSLIEQGRIEMLRGSPQDWPAKQKPDVYVFEHWVPSPWPTDRPALVLDPSSDVDAIRVRSLGPRGVPVSGVRAAAPDHPVLFRISASRLALTQTAILSLPSSMEPLWIAGAEPLLAAGEVSGQRLMISAFSPSRSESLALLPAFPLLLGNALYWCGESANSLHSFDMRRTGSVLSTTGTLSWIEWDGTGFNTAADESSAGLVALSRVGLWETADGRKGGCLLASETETNVPPHSKDALTAAATSSPTVQRIGWLRQWTLPQLLIWGIAILLLGESFLFHRKAVF